MNFGLSGKSALVTGSSKGIGEAIAKSLAEEGAFVFVHGRDSVKTEQVVSEILGSGGKAHGVTGDLTDDKAVENLISEATQIVGTIDILVNNAGGSGAKETWESTQVSSWSLSFDRNVLAALRVTKHLLPGMRRQHWGRVINISSVAGMMPPATGPDYSASKASLNAMTSSMARAVAKDGVTVNTISPGTIRSARLESAFRQAAESQGLTEPGTPWAKIEKAVLHKFVDVPLERVGTLEEVSSAVTFLASSQAGYITGVNLRIDGGVSPSI